MWSNTNNSKIFYSWRPTLIHSFRITLYVSCLLPSTFQCLPLCFYSIQDSCFFRVKRKNTTTLLSLCSAPCKTSLGISFLSRTHDLGDKALAMQPSLSSQHPPLSSSPPGNTLYQNPHSTIPPLTQPTIAGSWSLSSLATLRTSAPHPAELQRWSPLEDISNDTAAQIAFH